MSVEQFLHRRAYLGLQRLRGRPVGSFVRQLQKWQQLDRSVFTRVMNARLAEALEYASTYVPLYCAGPWRSALAHSDPENLQAWPLLERQMLRTRADELLARRRIHGMFYRHSSQSTGDPVHVALNPNAAAWSWANEYRAMLWHGVPIGARTLMLWGSRHPFADWVRNCRIFLTSNLSFGSLDAAATFLIERRPMLCSGLPSAMVQLARHLRAKYPDAPRDLVPFVKLGGEQVYDFQREEIARHLGARTIEFYGCTEVGAIAAECPAGSMHIFSEHVHVEIFKDGVPAPAGEFGDIVATSLVNRAMPLVRCRIGDCGSISPEPCKCGLPHPVLTQLLGRASDEFLAADGTKVHGAALGEGLKPLLERATPGEVRQVLFEQTTQSAWKVFVEGDIAIDVNFEWEITDIVRRTFGEDCEVNVERVPLIPRERSGKFRYYRSNSVGAR